MRTQVKDKSSKKISKDAEENAPGFEDISDVADNVSSSIKEASSDTSDASTGSDDFATGADEVAPIIVKIYFKKF